MLQQKLNQITDRSWIDIDLDAFTQNLRELSQKLLPHQKILQVVKADAYGHGASQIARVAIENGAIMLGVANIEEAFFLRFQKIEAPIIVLSPMMDFEIDSLLNNNIIPTISDINLCQKIDKKAKLMQKTIPIHLKIDTGMNRNGIKINDYKSFLAFFKQLTNVRITGLYSHFAASDEDESFSLTQYHKFLECVAFFKSDCCNDINQSLELVHISNSAGFLKYNTPEVNMVRLGLMTYGYNSVENTSPNVPKLKPIMSFKSRIAYIGTANIGETIGYNRTFRVTKTTKYAIIPVGYADGYDILLSNKSKVILKDILCPILGKVSMDMICVDVSAILNIQIADEVTLLGEQAPEIKAAYLANLYQGSVYELLCQVGRRAKRYYYKNGYLIDDEPLQRRAFIPNDFNTDKLNIVIQKAISQRIQDEDVAMAVYQEILENIFQSSDNDITYRSKFKYSIKFSECELSNLYKVKIDISFIKILQHDNFTITCANDIEKLRFFLESPSCEYRWLLDSRLELTKDMFAPQKMMIEGYEIKNELKFLNSCLVYHFSDSILTKLQGKPVHFHLVANTFYPKNSHQLPIYINEITKGIEVNFSYPRNFPDVTPTAIFSGGERFPIISKKEGKQFKSISIKTKDETWIFPSSGIVFSY